MTQRAVLYARVSSDDRGKDGRNLAGQLEMGRKYAQEHGYQVVTELAEDDRGASGAEINLPQLGRVRDMAAAGEFDVLVVRELDRLSRNLAKQLIVEQELKRSSVGIEYVIGEYPDTPEGDFQKHVKAVISEYERAKIKERSTRGRRLKVRAGHVIAHGNPPFGYRLAEVGGKRALVIHEPEARIVRLIFDWYTSGDETGRRLSSCKIARRLSTMNVPTWADVHETRKLGTAGRWSDTIVLKMLHSETYRGRWYYGRRKNSRGDANPREYWLLVEVPAIVTDQVWEAAQEQCRRNTIVGHNVKQEYLLRGCLACASCSRAMSAYSVKARVKGGRATYKYYRCNGATWLREHVCDLPHFRADQVDAAVWDWVKSFLTDPALLNEGMRAKQEEQARANSPLQERLAVIDDLLADNRRQLERALDLYLSGDFDKEMLTERRGRLEKVIEALESERAGLAAQLETRTFTDEQVQTITEFAEGVARGLEAADQDFEARRRVVEMLDVRATLAVEDGEKVAYAQCMLGDEVLSVRQPNTRS